MAGDELIALKAHEVLRECAFESLPIDPFLIAKKKDIQIISRREGSGVSGMLLRSGEAFAIAYAAHVASEGFHRFSISHELGHYFLPGHVEQVIGPGGLHESRAGFQSKDPFEIEADQFAANLLMPRALFRQALATAGEGLGAVEHLATRCKTSLTATAIRMVEFTDEPMAIVMSDPNDGRVVFSCMSKGFREMPEVSFLCRGERVPRGTATDRFNGDPGRVLEADREEDTVDLRTWFGTGPKVQLIEEVIGLGSYSKTLTVLTIEDVDNLDEDEDEERIAASWTPTFSRSKRR